MVQNVNDFIKQSAEDFSRSIEQSQLRDAEDNPADLGLHLFSICVLIPYIYREGFFEISFSLVGSGFV